MQLQTDGGMGNVSIANGVIAEIAGNVASNCYGVVAMAARSKTDGLISLIKADSSKGVNIVIADDNRISADIHIIVEYGVNINTICKSIVNRVRYALEQGVGLNVSRVNVKVEGVRTD